MVDQVQLAQYVAARPVEEFFGRAGGAFYEAREWLFRADWLGTFLVFDAEGAVSTQAAEVLRSNSKEPVTDVDWLMWSRVGVGVGDVADGVDLFAAEQVLEAALFASDAIDVATFATTLGACRAVGVDREHDALIVRLAVERPLGPHADWALRIAAPPHKVVQRPNGGTHARAEFGPDDGTWFVAVEGLALSWPGAFGKLTLMADDRRWVVDDRVAERAMATLCSTTHRAES